MKFEIIKGIVIKGTMYLPKNTGSAITAKKGSFCFVLGALIVLFISFAIK